MNDQTLLMIPQVSPKIHPPRVKLEKREKGLNIKKNNNSLFMFHPFTPTPPRDACTRVFACVREGVGERVNLGKHAFVSAGWRTFKHNEKETV
jgi:hypothetical protein